MIYHLFCLVYFANLVLGISTGTAESDSCPPPDGTTRSLWSILGSCGLTLLICVWHTIHFPVPKDEWRASVWYKSLCGLGSFFAPEVMIAIASKEWWKARNKVNRFREKGYEWSMTHSFFAGMGGFAYHYRDQDGKDCLHTIDSLDFLHLCEEDKITNPFIKAKEIKDRSKSDWLGKAILALQLVWFVLQVVVRGSRGLAVTLVELDTVCMGILSLFVIFLWWHKPFGPDCSHVFYAPSEVKAYDFLWAIKPLSDSPPKTPLTEDMRKALSDAWKPQPIFPHWLTACFTCECRRSDEETGLQPPNEAHARSEGNRLVDRIDEDDVMYVSLCATWLVLGGLHLVAWNFDFPTETEKIMWRVASLVLAGGSLAFFVVVVFYWVMYALLRLLWLPSYPLSPVPWFSLEPSNDAVAVFAFILGVVARAILAGLMLASLRALPCSAYQTISWTLYIPHL